MKLEMPTKDTLLKLRKLSGGGKYEDACWAYVDGSYPVRQLYLKRLENLLGILPEITEMKVVEVGTGSGILQLSLKKRGANVVGSDIHDHLSAVRIIMNEIGERLDLVRCDARHLPFAKESVNLVIGSSVLEHLKTEDLASAISDMYEILTPQGYLALGYPVESLPVRFFFRAIGFDFKSGHPSKARQIRENVEMMFGKPQKIKRLPLAFLPSAFAFYETSLFKKGAGSS